MKKVREVMTSSAECVSQDADLREVAIKMKTLNIGAVPVCKEGRLAGMITDRDIVIHAFAGTLAPDQIHVQDIMTSPIVFCYEDQDLEDAARLMEVKQIRRLVVLNRDKKLVGMLSLSDLALRGNSEELVGEILGKISEARTAPAAA